MFETHQNLHAELERRRWNIATQRTLSLIGVVILALEPYRQTRKRKHVLLFILVLP